MKKVFILVVFGIVFISGCVSSGSTKRRLDLLSVFPKDRIAIAGVPFYFNDGGRLVLTQPDNNIAYLIIAQSEWALLDKGKAAFFVEENEGLLSDSDVKVILETAFFFRDLIENKWDRKASCPAVDMNMISASSSEVPYVLFPVFVYKKGNMSAKILQSPGAFETKTYLFLVETKTGKIRWSNSYKMVGNYAAVEMNLRGFRWGHGSMGTMLENFPL